MTGELKLPAGMGTARNPAEDTVELELTAEEQLQLAQAAGVEPRQSDMPSGKPEYDSFICKRTDRIDFLCTVTFAALVLGVTTLSGWRAVVGQAPTPAVVTAAPLAPPAAAVQTEPPPPVVQVMNPFDASEVFEFPADTTQSAARDAMAEVLLQRARERHRQGLDVRRASNRRPTPVAADIPQDVFVTRVSGPASQFAGTASLRAGNGVGE